MIVHIIQAATLTVVLSFVSACRVYVTDCNGKILRNAGKKYCNGDHWHWDQAPGTPYCLHIQPLTEPQSNRYCKVSGGEACYKVDGDLTNWGIYKCNVTDGRTC
ncbi:hypothetical protein F8M41_000455 [Gigaspora margarita]|uniref:Secreted protein n=1 Tax=Gigaspora margarita TaxID=4874 RepID=A0A8H4ESN9_GIGMA|nr:hypothetical protein F8M41_000455 [Gigaspora margarita]